MPELIGSLAPALPDVVSSPLVTHRPDPEQGRAERYDRLLERRTTGSLLEAAVAKGGDAMLLDRLAALFRRRSEATMHSRCCVREGLRNELPTRSVPPVHLGGRGARQCRGRSHHGPPLRINALTAFILMQHPSLKAMQLPAALLDDSDKRIASAARITSGSLAPAGV